MKMQVKNRLIKQSSDLSCSSTAEPSTLGEHKSRRRHRWLAVLLWMMFGAGVLLQAVGPRLQVANNTLVIPPALLSEGAALGPAEIVAHERSKQLLSGMLTVGGALGVALYYRKLLVRSGRSLLQKPPCGPALSASKPSSSRAEHQKQQN